MKTLRAELHVHTVLSPCAEVEMIPPLIVREARERGIDLIAITDHNASGNIAAVQKAAQGSGLTVLPGMEVQTREEVHVLCLFDTLAQIAAWQAVVDEALPGFENNPEFFGEQYVVDETGDFIRHETRLLATSIDLSIEAVVRQVETLGGLAIPAHVERHGFGLLRQLGMVPADLKVEALEISRNTRPGEAASQYPALAGYPLLQSGDVHMLNQFMGACLFQVEAPSVDEIRMALRNEGGRTLRLEQ